MLTEAIEKTGRVALSRVVIAQRERTVVLRPIEGGLVAQTLHEQRDINNAKAVLDGAKGIKPDPDMVKLATQLIDRQTGTYEPSDIEDKYETRLRAMIAAKLKGEGIEEDQPEEPEQNNVVDLMAALRKSLGDAPEIESSGKGKAEPAKVPKKRAAGSPTAAKPKRKRA